MADVSVKVSADSTGVSTGLAKAQEAVNSFKESASESVKEVGGELTKAFAAGAVIEGVKSLAEEFDRVQKLSERFGESAETIQKVGQVATVSGTDIETVAKAMTHITDNGVQAAQGNEKMAGAFKVLNINAADFVDLPLEDKLLALSQGYEDGKSNAEKMNAVMQLLGKSGADLIPMLQQGRDALKQQFDSATVASNDAVGAISEATDTLEHDFASLKAYGADALGFLIRGIQDLGIGLAAVSAYVENLPHGLKAAKEAYGEVIQAAADLQADKAQAAQDEAENARKATTSTDDTKDDGELTRKNAEDAKKAAEDIARLKEENAKKIEEAHIRSVSLQDRQVEISKELIQLEKDYAQAKGLGVEKVALEIQGRALDLQKEQGENQKRIAEEKEKADREAKERAKEIGEDAIDKKKDALEAVKTGLEKLEHEGRRGVTVDSLRSIGGSIAGVNYHGLDKAEAAHNQAINLAKQQVQKLEQVIKVLERSQREVFDSNGAYTAP